MASSSTPGGKTMSSRLLTMKFMQRSAASASSPASSTSDERAYKRQRLSTGEPSRRENAELQAVQAALAAEEAKRLEVLERQAADAGETKWVLNLPRQDVQPVGFTVVSAGYGTIDSHGGHEQDEEDETSLAQRPSMQGRRSYGDFGKQEKSTTNDDGNTSDGSDSDTSNSEDEDDGRRRKIPSEAAEQARAKRQARKQDERADSVMLAERRRNKDVKLNRLSGISSGGGQKSRGAPSGTDMKCFNCGGPHKKAECPKTGRGKRY